MILTNELYVSPHLLTVFCFNNLSKFCKYNPLMEIQKGISYVESTTCEVNCLPIASVTALESSMSWNYSDCLKMLAQYKALLFNLWSRRSEAMSPLISTIFSYGGACSSGSQGCGKGQSSESLPGAEWDGVDDPDLPPNHQREPHWVVKTCGSRVSLYCNRNVLI